MSKSKSSLSFKEKKDIANSLLVDMTESSFFTEKQSDDAGVHLMVYLPECVRDSFDINLFRENIYKKIGTSRMCIAYVSEGFIKNKIK